jgi:hypothetical protein
MALLQEEGMKMENPGIDPETTSAESNFESVLEISRRMEAMTQMVREDEAKLRRFLEERRLARRAKAAKGNK